MLFLLLNETLHYSFQFLYSLDVCYTSLNVFGNEPLLSLPACGHQGNIVNGLCQICKNIVSCDHIWTQQPNAMFTHNVLCSFGWPVHSIPAQTNAFTCTICSAICCSLCK